MKIPLTPLRKALGDQPLDELLTQIKEIRIIDRDKTGDMERCAWFVFRDEEWYWEDRYHSTISLMKLDALDFLKSRGIMKLMSHKIMIL